MTMRNSNRKPRLTQEKILERFEESHGDKYLYKKFLFTGVDDKSIVTCRVHGDFEITPYHHGNRKQGCGKCVGKGKINQEYVICQFIEKHGNKYGYGNVVYKRDDIKVAVTCFEHGDFLVKPNNHKNGSGCPECGANRIGYGRSKFVARAKAHPNKKCILYVIKCKSSTENFYKIGVTTTSIKRRFDGFHMPYEFKVINEITGFDPEFIWDIEHKIHKILREFRLIPEKYFRGRTECFSEITPQMKRFIKTLESTEQLQLIA